MLEELCRDVNSPNEEIMKYIWEALGNFSDTLIATSTEAMQGMVSI